MAAGVRIYAVEIHEGRPLSLPHAEGEQVSYQSRVKKRRYKRIEAKAKQRTKKTTRKPPPEDPPGF